MYTEETQNMGVRRKVVYGMSKMSSMGVMKIRVSSLAAIWPELRCGTWRMTRSLQQGQDKHGLLDLYLPYGRHWCAEGPTAGIRLDFSLAPPFNTRCSHKNQITDNMCYISLTYTPPSTSGLTSALEAHKDRCCPRSTGLCTSCERL